MKADLSNNECYIKDGIYHLILKGDIDLDTAKYIIKKRQEVCFVNCLGIVDIRSMGKTTFSALNYFNSEEAKKNVKAGAILLNSKLIKHLINLLLKFRSKEIPTRFFTNEYEAIEWLKSI